MYVCMCVCVCVCACVCDDNDPCLTIIAAAGRTVCVRACVCVRVCIYTRHATVYPDVHVTHTASRTCVHVCVPESMCVCLSPCVCA
jgi:hypothetical protein